ncbi:LuxR C-terminal-related transcriptional regulator [Singulisphaera sp. Ch08]|uniref:helix-turn-helix transcriptional regulator n=1 Tax=Singulisphaera sp. Ch08 TaxID=3120278 RepID=UPI00387348F2
MSYDGDSRTQPERNRSRDGAPRGPLTAQEIAMGHSVTEAVEIILHQACTRETKDEARGRINDAKDEARSRIDEANVKAFERIDTWLQTIRLWRPSAVAAKELQQDRWACLAFLLSKWKMNGVRRRGRIDLAVGLRSMDRKLRRGDERHDQRFVAFADDYAIERAPGPLGQALAVDLRRCICKRLTPRGIEVLKLVEDGFSNEEIAEKLDYSVPTIERERHTIRDVTRSCDRQKIQGIIGRHRHELEEEQSRLSQS